MGLLCGVCGPCPGWVRGTEVAGRIITAEHGTHSQLTVRRSTVGLM